MLWTKDKKFQPYPYSQEAELEAAIAQVEERSVRRTEDLPGGEEKDRGQGKN